jgi:hypothetical protein
MAKPTIEASTPLVFRCFLCGVTWQVEDDGRRVRHAQVHVSKCPSGPASGTETKLHLITPDHLQLQLVDGSVWLEVRRPQPTTA